MTVRLLCEGRTEGLCRGSRAEKLKHDEYLGPISSGCLRRVATVYGNKPKTIQTDIPTGKQYKRSKRKTLKF